MLIISSSWGNMESHDFTGVMAWIQEVWNPELIMHKLLAPQVPFRLRLDAEHRLFWSCCFLRHSWRQNESKATVQGVCGHPTFDSDKQVFQIFDVVSKLDLPVAEPSSSSTSMSFCFNSISLYTFISALFSYLDIVHSHPLWMWEYPGLFGLFKAANNNAHIKATLSPHSLHRFVIKPISSRTDVSMNIMMEIKHEV